MKIIKDRVQYAIQAIDDFFSGRKRICDETKFAYMCHCIAAVHVVLAIVFLCMNASFLWVYNVISVIFYIRIGLNYARDKKFKLVYYSVFIEVIFFSCLATILAGTQWGFMIYIIALMPVSFYAAYVIPEFSKDLKKSFLIDLIAVFCYVLTRVLTDFITPVYPYPSSAFFLTAMHNFNAVVSFAMVIVFGAFFAVEVQENAKSLRSQNDALVSVSSVDPLTGLLNRRSMDKHLSKVVSHAKENGEMFAVIIADIDDFKKVNDTYGHNVGDEVLVKVSDTFKKTVSSDCSICRWGGEEILVLVPEGLKDARKIAEKIRENIAAITIKLEDGNKLHVTMTFGLSEYMPGYSTTKLIAVADEHLYFGKKHGKNCVVC